MRLFSVVGSLLFASAMLAQQPALPDSSEREIRQIPQALAAAWEQADSSAMAGMFVEDADLVIPSGEVLSGRPAIQSFYRAVFDRGYRGSHARSEIRRVRVVGATAIVDGSWSISGVQDGHGTSRPMEQGLFTAVLEKRGVTWYIMALREMVPSGSDRKEASR